MMNSLEFVCTFLLQLAVILVAAQLFGYLARLLVSRK